MEFIEEHKGALFVAAAASPAVAYTVTRVGADMYYDHNQQAEVDADQQCVLGLNQIKEDQKADYGEGCNRDRLKQQYGNQRQTDVKVENRDGVLHDVETYTTPFVAAATMLKEVEAAQVVVSRERPMFVDGWSKGITALDAVVVWGGIGAWYAKKYANRRRSHAAIDDAFAALPAGEGAKEEESSESWAAEVLELKRASDEVKENAIDAEDATRIMEQPAPANEEEQVDLDAPTIPMSTQRQYLRRNQNRNR